jgi:hypothetical protein
MARTTLAVLTAPKTDSKHSRRCGRLQVQLASYGIDQIGTTVRDCVLGLPQQHGGTSLVEGSDGAG